MFLNCCDAKKDISGIKSALILEIFNCYLFSYISSVKIKGEKKRRNDYLLIIVSKRDSKKN